MGALSFEERVMCQKSIDEVYWRNSLWPASNPQPKPGIETIMPVSQIGAKTQEYIRKSNAMEAFWQRPITSEQLQTEMERMAEETTAPDLLRELWASLNNDPNLIAECLARPILVDRFYSMNRGDESLLKKPQQGQFNVRRSLHNYRLPLITSQNGTGTKLAAAPISTILHTAVWTGTSMIVWGGNGAGAGIFDLFSFGDYIRGGELNTGAIYNPATNSWKLITTNGAPEARNLHTAVWTGTEMIIWGGHVFSGSDRQFNTGSRYNPMTDSWQPTSINGAPEPRDTHTAIWSGTEMIIFGGLGELPDLIILKTGSRYDPSNDSWKPTAQSLPRWAHTAIWTGTEMIVWGGRGRPGGVCCVEVNTGNRYDPSKNSWKSVTTRSAPSARAGHTAVWTGTEMIIWGGGGIFDNISTDTGGRYDPVKKSWKVITSTNAPGARLEHKAVWTGTEMIVWGGLSSSFELLKTGGRYDPSNGAWTATGLNRAPSDREYHSAVWTGTSLIIWGGFGNKSGQLQLLNTGGRYNPNKNSWKRTFD